MASEDFCFYNTLMLFHNLHIYLLIIVNFHHLILFGVTVLSILSTKEDHKNGSVDLHVDQKKLGFLLSQAYEK
jgi:hypothetical protein